MSKHKQSSWQTRLKLNFLLFHHKNADPFIFFFLLSFKEHKKPKKKKKMLDPAVDLLPATSSPTVSTVSSSDLDTEVFTFLIFKTFSFYWCIYFLRFLQFSFVFSVYRIIFSRQEHDTRHIDGSNVPSDYISSAVAAPGYARECSRCYRSVEEEEAGVGECFRLHGGSEAMVEALRWRRSKAGVAGWISGGGEEIRRDGLL